MFEAFSVNPQIDSEYLLPQTEMVAAAPEMVTKLIAAVRTAEKALDRIQMYRAGDYAHDCISIALSTLAKLQSGEFEEGDESIGGDGACKR